MLKHILSCFEMSILMIEKKQTNVSVLNYWGHDLNLKKEKRKKKTTKMKYIRLEYASIMKTK